MEMVREMTETDGKDMSDVLFKGTVHPLSDKAHLYELIHVQYMYIHVK